MKDKGVFRPGAGARGALARQGCAPGPGGQAGGRGDRMPGGRGAGRAGRPAAAHPRPGAAAVAAPGTPCGWRRSIRCRVPREGRKPIPIAIWVGQRPGASARGCLDVWLAGGGGQRAGACQTGGRDDRTAPAGCDGMVPAPDLQGGGRGLQPRHPGHQVIGQGLPQLRQLPPHHPLPLRGPATFPTLMLPRPSSRTRCAGWWRTVSSNRVRQLYAGSRMCPWCQ